MTALPEWMPIESAPRDGTSVLAVDQLENVAILFFDRRWRESYGFNDPVWRPTHWLPLPTPPAQTGEGE